MGRHEPIATRRIGHPSRYAANHAIKRPVPRGKQPLRTGGLQRLMLVVAASHALDSE